MQPHRQAQAAEEYLDASWGRLTQICALSRLNDELSKIKRRKGKHVLTPPCKQLNPVWTDVAPASLAFYCHEGCRGPSSTSTKNCLPVLKCWPMTDHLVTWLDIHMLCGMSQKELSQAI